jgi:ferredoxin-NADP reductase
MIPISTLLAGTAFVALASVNVVLMLETSRPTCTLNVRRRLIACHRIGGYLFVILLCIMVGIMSQRLVGLGLWKAPTFVVIHVALALVLGPLLGLKILIARRYKHLHALLMPLGLAIFAISFVLVSLPVLSQALQSGSPRGLGIAVALVIAVTLCLLLCSLAARRMKKRSDSSADPIRIPLAPLASTHSTTLQEVRGRTMTLHLAHIEQQTHDTKTLRFLVPAEKRFRAKPGQFLTFHWFIKGKRVLRSYTISSSPIHTDYVEITPKRVENGCVSNFLHDEAKLGLTVEASGPHGKFFFDPTAHRSIVLIAAGSGITPMISMIRYTNDLRLPTPVTLLYCVRTRNDIIFEAELDRLRSSVPNFNYAVSLSQPDDNWSGNRGHLTQEYVFAHVTDLDKPTYFLCGPRGFMENARQILTSLGVNESRITQESFGEKPGAQETNQTHANSVESIEFVSSQKTCASSPGSTLLEVAEANGVQIPFGCRQGQCGTCATRVLCGAVHMETDTGLTAEQKKAGFVLPCVSRAEGNVVVAA